MAFPVVEAPLHRPVRYAGIIDGPKFGPELSQATVITERQALVIVEYTNPLERQSAMARFKTLVFKLILLLKFKSAARRLMATACLEN